MEIVVVAEDDSILLKGSVTFKATVDAVRRAEKYFDLVRAIQEGRDGVSLADLYDFMSEQEKRFFLDPKMKDPVNWEEFNPFNDKSPSPPEVTILPKRLQWVFFGLFGGMIVDNITQEGNEHHLNFHALEYPFGDAVALVVLLECMGHAVLGYNDGIDSRNWPFKEGRSSIMN